MDISGFIAYGLVGIGAAMVAPSLRIGFGVYCIAAAILLTLRTVP